MPDADTILSIKAAGELSGGLSEATLRRLSKSGQYPPLIPILVAPSGRAVRVGYSRVAVERWCAERLDAARNGR